jgi:hypothetical protein
MGDHQRAKKITSACRRPYSRRRDASSPAIAHFGYRTGDCLAPVRARDRSYAPPLRCRADALLTHCYCESTTYVHGHERVASPGDNRHCNTEPVPECLPAAVHNIPRGRKNLQESCCCVTTRHLESTPKTVPAPMDSWLNLRPHRRPLFSRAAAALLLGRGVFGSPPIDERLVDVWPLASVALLGGSGGFGNNVGSSDLVGILARTPCADRFERGNVGKSA